MSQRMAIAALMALVGAAIAVVAASAPEGRDSAEMGSLRERGVGVERLSRGEKKPALLRAPLGQCEEMRADQDFWWFRYACTGDSATEYHWFCS